MLVCYVKVNERLSNSEKSVTWCGVLGLFKEKSNASDLVAKDSEFYGRISVRRLNYQFKY